MPKLRELEPVVKEILINNEEARKDDFILINSVYGLLFNNNTRTLSFESIMLNHKAFKLPSFESITRCRRKIQEKHPELRDAQAVELRVEEQEGYIKYALNI